MQKKLEPFWYNTFQAGMEIFAPHQLYHYMDDSKVEECISMHINMCNFLALNPNNYNSMPLNTYFMIA